MSLKVIFLPRDVTRRKLLAVSERYPPEGGGAELATHLTIGILKDHFDVVVLAGVTNPVQHSSVEYLYDPLLSRWEKPILWYNALKLIRSERFRRLVRDVDLVYVPRMVYPIVPYVKGLGKRVVVHLHDYAPVAYAAAVLAPFEERGGRVRVDNVGIECVRGPKYCLGALALGWLPGLARRWISHADGVLCASRRHAEIVGTLAPELRGKIAVVYNPVPEEWFVRGESKRFEDPPLFLYVGGDSRVKGFRVLANALSILRSERLSAKFVFAGSYGPRSVSLLKSLSEKRSLDIEVLGRTSRDRLELTYLRAWALLFPSIIEEPLPYAVAEAAAFRALPIASRVGGVPELLSGSLAENFMFRPRDHVALASLISLVANMPIDDLHKISRDVSGKARRLLAHASESLVKYFKSLT